MPLILIVLSGLAFAGLHEFNLFAFADLSFNSHISAIYLPAFIRMLNVLVLGPLNGTLATGLGGLFILPFEQQFQAIELANITCSSLGPLSAMVIFRLSFARSVQLSVTKDLLVLSLIYSLCNATLHHITWAFLDPHALVNPLQFFEMIFGDFTGTLAGSLLLKTFVKLPFIQKRIETMTKL